MKFDIDIQTLKDLDIFETIKNKSSVFGIFNHVTSLGGKNILEYMLQNPMSDVDMINERKNAISFFAKNDVPLDIDKQSIDFIEYYLQQGNYPTQKASRIRSIERAIMYKLKPTEEYYIIERGINYLIDILNTVSIFIYDIRNKDCPILIERQCKIISEYFEEKEYTSILQIKGIKKLRATEVAKYDYMFRYTHKNQIRFILDFIYEYDVFICVAKTANKWNFSYPEILSDSSEILEIEGLFHPFVKDAVTNNITFSENKNLAFISGPNMAGKSTFLKALGIAVYLAHVGFPVPAHKVRLSVLTGLSTTINLSDNLNQQQSHFYAEVLRIKDVALKIKERGSMLVIFDELFRGTNVKDASEGSLAVISAFAQIRSCFFAISTHIIEIAKDLDKNKNIQFCYFDVEDIKRSPIYTYKLKDGITDDRMGMYIIDKEKVIETINSIKE